ncbi:cyclin family protein [Abortiporus biennis]
MSSNVPVVRRTTRTTSRSIPINNNKENNLRAKATLRAKPPSSSSAAPVENGKPTTTTVRATTSTIATRARASSIPTSRIDPAAQGKRKREALGEVPRPPANVKAGTSDVGGKGKEKAKEKFDGVVLKKPVSSTSTRTTTRAHVVPGGAGARSESTGNVANTATRKTRSATTIAHPQPTKLEDVQEDEEEEFTETVRDENAMVIDHPIVPVPSPRRFVAARAAVTVSRTTTTTTRTQVRRGPPRHVPKIEEDAENARAHKKRRTSSEAPEVPSADLYAEEEVEEAVKVEEDDYEAEPTGKKWTDLDADDGDDPLMVSEYVVEIFEYLKEVEQTTMPNPNYMESQKDLAWKMRGILTDWLIQVHSRFRLLPETLFLCVNIIDRFLSQRVVSLAKLQLVGITCMFIAAKVEEIVAPSATNFLYCADSSYSETDILQAERYVLKTIEWNMSYPSPINFLRRISKADDYNIQVRTVAKYLLEIQCLEWRLIAAPPSLIAAAAIWLARLILGYTEWTPNLAHYSSYPESALIPTANMMLNYILKPIRHQSFFKKYASKRFLKASVFVREWATEKWPESSQVSLHDELPVLKRQILEAAERNMMETGVEEYTVDGA